MIDISKISSKLFKGEDGIWYSEEKESVSYPCDGNDSLLDIEEESYWFRHRNNCITTIVNKFPPENNKTIFDIGGGNGFVSLGLMKSGYDVVLVEPYQSGANNAKSKGVNNVICSTCSTAGFINNSIPNVGLFDVLEHIEDDDMFLNSIYNILSYNGMLYLTVPAYNILWSNDDVIAGHYRRYKRKQLIKKIEINGFKVLFSSYIFKYLPIPIFLLRTLPNKIGFFTDNSDVDKTKREHSVSNGFVNTILNKLLLTEINHLSNTSPILFGGSCIIAAKK